MSAPDVPEQHQSDLVVIGSSAGGIEALSVLLGSLREDFPAPIVLAQHLDPSRPSHLAETLQRRSAVPVELVEDRTKMRPGVAYVVPSNRHVVIQDGHVEVTGDYQERPRPSVDLLFTTAAKAYGDRLIAVILTGAGTDGAAGAIDVKKEGGTVVVQNPATARYPSMPLAMPPTAIDHVADLERIGPLLYDVLTGSHVVESDDGQKAALGEILRIVSRYAEIDFRQYKSSTILRRIGRRMAITHCQSLADYAEHLTVNPAEVAELTMAFLIKVTEFFRDAEAYEFLREEVVPELVARGRENNRVLRCWSAGCATGEEPYSLALLFAEYLGPELPEWSIKIFATDIDERSIEFARRGLYPPSVLESLPPDLASRYFEAADGGVRIAKPVRQMVIFGQQDLTRAAPFPRIDLVVCRNLLIYFKPDLQQQILDSFAYSLARNGYLFLGKAEVARPSKAIFELADKRWKVYRCTSCPAGIRPSVTAGVATSLGLHERRDSGTGLARGEAAPASYETVEAVVGQLRRFNELVLRLLPVGVVVLDRAYRIVTISGAARRLLGVRELGVEQDFLHTVRGLPYARVRASIDEVFRERTAATLAEVELDPASGGDGRYVMLTIVPILLDGGSAELAVLSVMDVTEQVQTRRRLEAVQSEQAQLVDELGATNRRLGEVNRELHDANEELQAANEELMLTQEELQASNEEFEATNEELQATNEELETNNEELQATNEELEATNEELSARTQELYELTRDLETEQSHLARVVEMGPYAIAVLRGPQLEVVFANNGFSRMFPEAGVRGRLFERVLGDAPRDGVLEACRDAYLQGEPRTVRGETAAGPVSFSVTPTHDGSGTVDGLVLYAQAAGEAAG